MNLRLIGALSGLALIAAAPLAAAQAAGELPTPKPIPGFGAAPKPNGPGAPVQVIKVHGKSLEGNLEGDAVDRDVVVILPPSYAKSPHRRYPVIYFMHGFGITADWFAAFMHAPETMLAWSKNGPDVILVMPDTDTKFGGSMYSSSPTTGDFEGFIANDLTSYIDSHYRTLARRSSRGLVGHSMGGYGVWKVAMRFPEEWGAIYAMSACCMSPRTTTAEQAQQLAAIPYDKAPTSGFGSQASLASIAAWSPDPKKPPYYMDFGLTADGKVDNLVVAKWANNSPLAMATSHIDQLKSFKAVASDGGDQDGLTKDATTMHEQLDLYGVKNSFEVYDGNHVNRIAERFQSKVLPFFASHLAMK